MQGQKGNNKFSLHGHHLLGFNSRWKHSESNKYIKLGDWWANVPFPILGY